MSEPNDTDTTVSAPTDAPGHSPAPWREVGLEILDADGHAIATVWRSAAIDLGVSATNARIIKNAPRVYDLLRRVAYDLERGVIELTLDYQLRREIRAFFDEETRAADAA